VQEPVTLPSVSTAAGGCCRVTRVVRKRRRRRTTKRGSRTVVRATRLALLPQAAVDPDLTLAEGVKQLLRVIKAWIGWIPNPLGGEPGAVVDVVDEVVLGVRLVGAC